MSNPVTHPDHYTQGEYKCKHCGKPIECIDIVQWMTFSIGAAVKYLWRYKDKGNPVQDLQKAKQYIDFEIDKLKVDEPEEPEPPHPSYCGCPSCEYNPC